MTVEFAVGVFVVRPAERRVYEHGRPVALGARAFDLLVALIDRRDRVVSKDELLAAVWPSSVVEEGNLAVQVSAVRKLFGNEAVATVPGRGYRFTAPVTERPSGASGASMPEVATLQTDSPEPAPERPTARQRETFESLMEKLRAPASAMTAQAASPVGLSASAAAPGALPAALTPLLGRDASLSLGRQRLLDHRCLTLTGAGGSGKSRLALALAHDTQAEHPGGAWWVGLDLLTDPRGLASLVAQTIGVEGSRLPPMQALVQHLAGRRALLVLDNCEHLIDDVAALATRLLQTLPELRLLATSREALRIAGEHTCPVPPLQVPPEDDDHSVERLMGHGAVQLLTQRIAQHEPDFELTAAEAPWIARICRGLEGLPLALELVAAQVGPMTLAQVAGRLDDSLSLLRLGQRGGVRHHQTMSAAIGWGCRLLSDVELAVFQRLSVFVGGWTAASAAAACDGIDLAGERLPDVMARLVRASLVMARSVDGDLRFRMLEPVRQYAQEALARAGMGDVVRRQVLVWTVEQARLIAPQLSGPQQAQGYQRLDRDLDNLRACLAWSRLHDLADGLRLASQLWRFWQVKGHAQEMLAWFDEVLPRADAVPAGVRADACNAAGVMARTCGQYPAAIRLLEDSLALQRAEGQRRGEAVALNNLCVVARDQFDHAGVERHGRASLAMAREIGDRQLEGLALMHLGTALRGQDRPTEAEAVFEQSVSIFRELGDTRALGTLLNFLGNLAQGAGRLDEAEGRYTDSLALNRELDDAWGLGISCFNLASLHAARQDPAQAMDLLRASLAHYRRAGARHGLENGFELLAELAMRRGEPARAAWCWGVVEALEQEIGKVVTPQSRSRRGLCLQALADGLAPDALQAALAEGRGMSATQAIDAVLGESPAAA